MLRKSTRTVKKKNCLKKAILRALAESGKNYANCPTLKHEDSIGLGYVNKPRQYKIDHDRGLPQNDVITIICSIIGMFVQSAERASDNIWIISYYVSIRGVPQILSRGPYYNFFRTFSSKLFRTFFFFWDV